jgi:hypothetical protein
MRSAGSFVLLSTQSAIAVAVDVAALFAALLTVLVLRDVTALLRRTALAGAGLIAHAAFLTVLAGLRATALLITTDLVLGPILALLTIARSGLLRLLTPPCVAACLLIFATVGVGPIVTLISHFKVSSVRRG